MHRENQSIIQEGDICVANFSTEFYITKARLRSLKKHGRYYCYKILPDQDAFWLLLCEKPKKKTTYTVKLNQKEYHIDYAITKNAPANLMIPIGVRLNGKERRIIKQSRYGWKDEIQLKHDKNVGNPHVDKRKNKQYIHYVSGGLVNGK